MQREWNIRDIYLYLVCLVTLIMLIVGTSGLVRNVAQLIYPQPSRVAAPVTAVAPDDLGYDPEAWEQQQEVQRQWDRRSTILSMVGNVALLLVAGPLYRYHWDKAEHGESPLLDRSS